MQRQRKITNMGVKSGKQGENNVSTPAAANSEGVMADPTPPPVLAPVQPVQPLDVDSLVERITAEVLKALEASLDKKMDPVLLKLQTCTSDIASLDTRVSGAEQRISAQEDVTESHDAKLSEMELKLEAALEKIDDLENRGRRCNLRIVGLEEGSEGTNPVSFFKSWLPALVGESDNFKGGVVKIDRCHRALTRRPPAGQRPRAVIMKLHNFQDKVRIMQAARRLKTLSYKGASVMIFEDFSAAVVKKRQECTAVKRRCREQGIVFAMLYPAVLRIRHRGEEKLFRHPADATGFLDGLIGVRMPSPASS
uniref:LINE-1 type transposase domain-containing protein 1 n=1 Tax=Knipowitschia caucasica TaxID=637954 RepID=A0AAV2KN58_KNICA